MVNAALLADLGLAAPFGQLCVVIPDLDAAVRDYAVTLGIGPWVGWRYDGDFLRYRTYRGSAADWSMRLAITTAAGPQLELVEPGPGPSVLGDFLERRGAGIQHVAYFVPAFDPARRHLEDQGAALVQGGGGHGLDGDGQFGYFDLPRLGIVLEIIERPVRRPEPHFRYDIAGERVVP